MAATTQVRLLVWSFSAMHDSNRGMTISAHEQLGGGVGVTPINTPFGTNRGRGARRNVNRRPCLHRACDRTAEARHGPRDQQAKRVGYDEYVTRPCGLMDKALVFGAKDCRLESCRGHFAS